MSASTSRLAVSRLPAGPTLAILVAVASVGGLAVRPKPAPRAAAAVPAPVQGIVATPLAPPPRPQSLAAVDAMPTGALPPAVADPWGPLQSPATPEAEPDSPRLAPAEISRFVDAAAFYRKNQFPQGDAASAAITDPIERAALDWIALRVAATPPRLDAFAAAHPDWPLADWMQAVHEGWLFSGKPSPTDTLAIFAKAEPTTAGGRLALARAKLAGGDRDAAQKIVSALWRDGDLDFTTETAITREFMGMLTRDDHRARADRLLYAERGAAAWRAAALAGPDVLALASARLEAARGPLSARASSAVPPALRTEPGYYFAHVQDSRRSGRLDEAISWLQLSPKDPAKLVDGDKWWTERRMIARMLLDRGAYEKAYTVCADATPNSSPSRVDASFHAGWIALRFLNDPTRAAPHFAAAAAAAETPLSIARANYWRGRAAEALSQEEEARGYYAKAAAYPIAYYGQLAAQKLGAAEITPRRPAIAAIGEARAEATRVVELYLAAGLDDFVQPVAFGAARVWTDGAQLAALSEVLRNRASAATNVVFGKIATERGFPLDAVAFPTFGLPSYLPLAGSASAEQVMAVARQESEFLPRASSGVGAKGLMQIMPYTAADTARKAGIPYDYARLIGDPAYNMQLGAVYLGQLVAAEGGSLEMAAAAYNAGAGRVAQWVAAYGDPRNGADLVDWVERIPYDETRDYVERVMENYRVYQARLAEGPEPRMLAGALAKR